MICNFRCAQHCQHGHSLHCTDPVRASEEADGVGGDGRQLCSHSRRPKPRLGQRLPGPSSLNHTPFLFVFPDLHLAALHLARVGSSSTNKIQWVAIVVHWSLSHSAAAHHCVAIPSAGIHIFVANNLLKAFCEQGGLLVGWQLESDLKALGLTEAGVLAADAEGHPPYGRRMGLPIGTPAHPVDANIVELTDVYRTAEHGAKCTLAEAYTAVFTRTMSAHDAADDAAMTMELYRYWRDAGSPDRISIAVAFHVVNAHTFAPDRRSELLWRFLRPTRRDRDVVIERDDGENVFQLKFRRLADRDAFVTELRRRVREDGPPHGVWWGQEVPGEPQGSVQVNCGAFRIHLFEQLR